VSSYSDTVSKNVVFLGSRARELAEQEVERARSLDTKTGAIVAASVALIGASVAFISRLADLDGGSGAKTLWAAELIVALIGLLIAGALGVWALVPRVTRSSVAFHEIQRWETPRVLEADETLNRGVLLRADVHGIGLSRNANGRKARRQRSAWWALAGALVSISALTISIAVHSAAHPASSNENIADEGSTRDRSEKRSRFGGERRAGARRADVPPPRSGP
jgi:hypothetical protein